MYLHQLPKTLCLVLAYFSLHFTMTLVAQQNISRFSKLHGYNMSQKEGILSKIDPFQQKSPNENTHFYSNAYLDKKHGLIPYPSENRNSDYGYLEHLGTGMNIPYS